MVVVVVVVEGCAVDHSTTRPGKARPAGRWRWAGWEGKAWEGAGRRDMFALS